nr:putative ribonuclease H-like domain-containing protein [Tanacetum cinerariifolium]
CSSKGIKESIVLKSVGNKILKAFPLSVKSSHCQKKFPLLLKKVPLLKKRDAIADKDCTANEDKGSISLSQEQQVVSELGKFEQWKFKIQQYLQNEHYALWEVIEFGDSYKAPKDGVATGSASDGKKGRTVAVTTEDMQKRRNDVKARTTLLLALPNEHQLRFSKKTKKNLLKQQYGNFKAEGKETLEQTFNRLQAIISHLEFMDVEINISLDTAYAYIASQSNGSQIKYEDINQIDEDDIEEMDIKAPRSKEKDRRENFRQGSKEEEQAPKALMMIDKVGLSQVEARLVEFKNQEIKFCEKIRGLEFSVECKTNIIENLTNELETLKKEKEGLDSKLTCFKSATKYLNNLIGSQISNKIKKGLGYSDILPPPAQVYSPPKKDMSWTGLPEFVDDTITDILGLLLVTPRQHNMYSIDLNNVVPHKDLTCLVAKVSANECMLWHRRLGKQHKASCKTKLVNSVTKPLHTLHIDLFGLTSDKTSGILRNFITKIENPKELKEDYQMTSQQNRVVERRNRTLIEAARTMLADAKLPVTFWAEAVNTACYVQNRVLVNKSQNKTPYELFNGRSPAEVKGDEGTNSTNFSGTKEVAGQDVKKDVSSLRYIALPNWFHKAHLESSTSNAQDACNADAPESSGNSNPTASTTNPPADHMQTLVVETPIPTVSLPIPTACLNDSPKPSSDTRLISKSVTSQDDTPSLDNILSLTNRIHKDHLKSQIIGPVDTSVQTRTKSKENVWSLVDCPKGVRPIGTKWVLKNKKDERGIVIRNNARLVAQGHTQEEGIDYDEVFTPVVRIKDIRLFLAYASFMRFIVYQMDVNSAF